MSFCQKLLRRWTHKLHFTAGDIRNVHVVSGRAQLFQLLASEDIQCNQMDLGVTMLSGLGSRHIDNLAGATLDHNMTVLAESGALHGEGGGSAGIGALESVLMLYGISM